MYKEHPFMQYLDFTYSSFGKPEIGDAKLRIPALEFSVTKGFPNLQFETIFKNGYIILEGVKSSRREISEYKTHENHEFLPAYTVTDGPFHGVSKASKLYEFDLGGHSYNPRGWIEWIVIAENIAIEGEEILKVFDE